MAKFAYIYICNILQKIKSQSFTSFFTLYYACFESPFEIASSAQNNANYAFHILVTRLTQWAFLLNAVSIENAEFKVDSHRHQILLHEVKVSREGGFLEYRKYIWHSL